MTKPKQPWRCQRCSSFGIIMKRASPRSKICKWCADELVQAGKRWCAKGRHGASDWPSRHATVCRACQKAVNQAYRAEHREEMLAYNRDHYAAHRDERLAYNHAYYDANRERLLAQKREYYEQHRETIKAKCRAYRGRRPPASIAKERARQQAKRRIYKANERAASQRRKFELWRRMLGREAA